MEHGSRTLALIAVCAALVALLTAAACAAPSPAPSAPAGGASAHATASPSHSSDVPGGQGGGAATGDVQTDWQHTLQVVANVRAHHPTVPAVYLLGGSVARECIVNETSWTSAVDKAGAGAVVAYDLGSSNRTTAQDIKIVQALPKTPAVVLIGMNVGRFTPARPRAAISLPLPSAAEPLPAWAQHHYTTPLSAARKHALVQKWMSRRYPLFKQHYAYNLGALKTLIQVCQKRGFHPVLLDLPRNKAIIGTAMDTPVNRYHRSCATLASTYHIPFLTFVGKAGLVNVDFYDLWHLLGTGRAKFQPLLASRTASLLLKYGMVPSPTPSPSPSS